MGPWLRRYSNEPVMTGRERPVELATAAGVGLGSLVALAGILLVFLRYPFPTVGVLVVLWVVGFITLTIKRRRAAKREQELRDSAWGD